MDRTFDFGMDARTYLLVEMVQAAEARFGMRADQHAVRTAVADAAQELLRQPVQVTDYLGDLAVNHLSRVLA